MNTETFVPFLFETLAKSALILAAAALIDRAWWRASAAQRHLVWCAALGAVLLLPLTRVIEPRWNVPLQRVTVQLPQERRADLPVLKASTVHEAAVPPTLTPRWHWPDWKHVAVFAWAAGAGLLVLSRLLGTVRLAVLRRATHPLLDSRVQRLAAETFRKLGIRRPVELRLSLEGCVPLTWGTLRPVLMLPAEAPGWSDARLSAALRHEAGHIARGDHFTRWIASLACALHWPNPLVWLAARRLRTAQEEATDDLVLRGGTAPEEYAAQLFDVARTLAAQHHLARHAVAMASPSTLERRMLAIVDERRDRQPLTLRAITGGVLAVALTLGLATAAQVQAQQEAAAPVRSAEKKKSARTGEVPRPNRPQVEIETKFIEITGDRADLPDFLKEPDSKRKDSVVTTLSAGRADAVVKGLANRKGVDLLYAPRVTTFSKQAATIEVGRQMRYATAWDKDAKTGGWVAKTFDTKHVGVTFEVTPELNRDGTISLHLVPEVTEFEGFLNLDATPAKRAAGKPVENRVTVGNGGEGNLKGVRTQPIFDTRRMDTRVTAKVGDTIVLGGSSREEVQMVEDKVPILGDIPVVGRLFKSTVQQRRKKRLIVLVTARIVEPGRLR